MYVYLLLDLNVFSKCPYISVCVCDALGENSARKKVSLAPPPPGCVCCPFYGEGSVVIDSLFIVAPMFLVWSLLCST